MKKLIKLLFGLFRRKPASMLAAINDGDFELAEIFEGLEGIAVDVDPKMSKKMKEIFGTDHRFAELLVYDEDSRKKVERLLETIEEDPDRL